MHGLWVEANAPTDPHHSDAHHGCKIEPRPRRSTPVYGTFRANSCMTCAHRGVRVQAGSRIPRGRGVITIDLNSTTTIWSSMNRVDRCSSYGATPILGCPCVRIVSPVKIRVAFVVDSVGGRGQYRTPPRAERRSSPDHRLSEISRTLRGAFFDCRSRLPLLAQLGHRATLKTCA